MRIRARHYATAEPVELTISDGGGELLSAGWVAPSFCDIQINGALRRSFISPELTAGDALEVASECERHGIGPFCPTLITGSPDALEHGFRTLARARHQDADLAGRLPGYHLEGPFISGEDGPRGAHPLEHVRDPDWDMFARWQDAAEGRIRIVTLAPERPGSLPFIERLSAAGVVVAIGHTGAEPAVIRDAVAAGARISTHLGNGAHARLSRHPNYIWEQLAADDLWASLITDGHHLPDAVVRCVLRVKTAERLILTCDASSLAGCPPGRYREWGADVEVSKTGRVSLAGTPYLAGAGVFTDACVAHAARFTEVGLKGAVEMASVRPRELLGEPIPLIREGEPADLVCFDWEVGSDLRVVRVVRGGRIDTIVPAR